MGPKVRAATRFRARGRRHRGGHRRRARGASLAGPAGTRARGARPAHRPARARVDRRTDRIVIHSLTAPPRHLRRLRRAAARAPGRCSVSRGWTGPALRWRPRLNLATLAGRGFAVDELSGAGANDLFIAVRAGAQEVIDAAREAGEAALFATDRGRGETLSNFGQISGDDAGRGVAPPTRQHRRGGLGARGLRRPGSAQGALGRSACAVVQRQRQVADEIALKDRATDLGLLVMGPGAGTAMLGGTCLGFANVVRPGPGRGGRRGRHRRAGGRRAVATAGALGVSARDRAGRAGSRARASGVGWRWPRSARWPRTTGTDAILLVSKPPDPDVARAVLAAAGDTPLIAALIGVPESCRGPGAGSP